MVNWSRGECPLKSFGRLSSPNKFAGETESIGGKRQAGKQARADSCKKQPRREVRRDQTSFSRAPPRIARRFFLRGKKLTSGSDWQKNRSVLLRSGCLPDSVVRFLLPIWRVARRRFRDEQQKKETSSWINSPCVFRCIFLCHFWLSVIVAYVIISHRFYYRIVNIWKFRGIGFSCFVTIEATLRYVGGLILNFSTVNSIISSSN